MTPGMQVVACEIEEFMRDFSQPWFERAGVADKVPLGPTLRSPINAALLDAGTANASYDSTCHGEI